MIKILFMIYDVDLSKCIELDEFRLLFYDIMCYLDNSEEYIVDFEKLITKTIKFKSSDIKFNNIQQGLLNKFDKDKKLSIKIRGLEKDIKNLSHTDLVPYIDLGKLDVGKHTVKVKLENTNNIEIIKDAVLEVVIEDSNKVTQSNGDKNVPEDEENEEN